MFTSYKRAKLTPDDRNRLIAACCDSLANSHNRPKSAGQVFCPKDSFAAFAAIRLKNAKRNYRPGADGRLCPFSRE